MPFSADRPKTLPGFKSEAGKARYASAYNDALAAWPVPYEELDLPTRFGVTHVIASGPADAPPLVLLPSFAGTATVWRLNIAGLSRQYRTYALDVIGQPGKSVATRRMRNRKQYADWLCDVFDGLGVRRASIVGCSFGGFLALNQAALRPERVERVVLIGPAGVFASQYWKLFYIMRIRRPVLALARRLTRRTRAAGLAALYRNASQYIPPRDDKWSALMSVTMTESPKVSVISASAFSTTQLRAIQAPTLLLVGENEQLYRPHEAVKLARDRMPALRCEVVPNADHVAAMAQPEDVNERIVGFLSS